VLARIVDDDDDLLEWETMGTKGDGDKEDKQVPQI
jgi:hypothetical protein